MPKVLDNTSILYALAEEKLGYSFGKPERVNDDSLSVVLPILRESVIPRSYTTFPETDKLNVKDSGAIAIVKAHNVGDRAIFLRSGTIFKGETQERTAVRSTVILPGATVEIQVRCVHASRGINPNAKINYGGTIPLSMEQDLYGAGFAPANQSDYWNSVQNNTAFMKCHVSGTDVPLPISYTPHIRSGQFHPRPRNAPTRNYGQPSMRSRAPQMMASSTFAGSPAAAYTAFSAGVLDSAASRGDDLATHYAEFSNSFDDILSKINRQEKQAGLALITAKGCQTIEVFDAEDSWKALHSDAIKRLGPNMAAKDDASVFEYKPEKAVEVVRNVLRLPFEENLIHEHKPTNGDPHFSLTGLSAKGWTGEVVELDGKVIHLMLLKIT